MAYRILPLSAALLSASLLSALTARPALAQPATQPTAQSTTQPTTQSAPDVSPEPAPSRAGRRGARSGVRAAAAAGPTSAPSREALLAEVTSADLPNLTYSAESILRFNSALLKLPTDKRQHLFRAIGLFRDANPDAPELAHLLPIRWRILMMLTDPEDYAERREIYQSVATGASTLIQHAAAIEQANTSVTQVEEMLRKGQPMEYDATSYTLASLLAKYPGDPATAFLYRRRVEAAPPGEERNTYEQTLLTSFADTPAVKQYQAQKSLAEDAAPLELPFDAPKDKPLLIHFFSPAAPNQAAYFDSLKSVAEKFKDAVVIICVPVDATPEAAKAFCDQNGITFPQPPAEAAATFAKSQGITSDELPVTYLLGADHHLASIRYDTRFDRPLQHLLAPQ